VLGNCLLALEWLLVRQQLEEWREQEVEVEVDDIKAMEVASGR